MKPFKMLCGLLALIFTLLSCTSCAEDHMDAFIYVEFDAKAQVLDPQLAKTAEELTVTRSIFDTLLRFDEKGKLVPSAAKSFEQKGNVYTFKLREDAKWTDGTPVTAADFVFALRRGVDPKTKAPYASTLFAVRGARDIYEGKAELNSLGVTAVDKHTLKIELEKDDPEFKKVLTTSITMPCNEKFFNSCKGKYGLTIDTTPSNGSYYVKEWFTESKFLIRLAKNLEYKGGFEANSMRIYFTCSENDALTMLQRDNTDLAYISSEEYGAISAEGFKLHSTEDTCYVLLVNKSIDTDVRQAMLQSINPDGLKSALISKQRVAKTLYPDVLKVAKAPKAGDFISYDAEAASQLYAEAALDGRTPNTPSFKYPADPVSEKVAKTLAARWQQNLSLFINIENSSESVLSEAYRYGGYDVMILPFSAPLSVLEAYQSAWGFGSVSVEEMSKSLFETYSAYPLYFSTTNVAAGEKIQNLDGCIQNGILDVAMLIKNP